MRGDGGGEFGSDWNIVSCTVTLSEQMRRLEVEQPTPRIRDGTLVSFRITINDGRAVGVRIEPSAHLAPP